MKWLKVAVKNLEGFASLIKEMFQDKDDRRHAFQLLGALSIPVSLIIIGYSLPPREENNDNEKVLKIDIKNIKEKNIYVVVSPSSDFKKAITPLIEQKKITIKKVKEIHPK